MHWYMLLLVHSVARQASRATVCKAPPPPPTRARKRAGRPFIGRVHRGSGELPRQDRARAHRRARRARKLGLPDRLQAGLPGEVGRPRGWRQLGVRRVGRHEQRERQRRAARRQRSRQRPQQPARVALLRTHRQPVRATGSYTLPSCVSAAEGAI